MVGAVPPTEAEIAAFLQQQQYWNPLQQQQQQQLLQLQLQQQQQQQQHGTPGRVTAATTATTADNTRRGTPPPAHPAYQPVPGTDISEALRSIQAQMASLEARFANGGAARNTAQNDYDALAEGYGSPQVQRSPVGERFPFPEDVLYNLPATMDMNNLVLHRYQVFPEWQALEQAQRGQPDRAGSLVYEMALAMTTLAIMSLLRDGLQQFKRCLAHCGLNARAQTVLDNSLDTFLYNTVWVSCITSARMNCIQEFSRKGRDGLVALHQRYFAPTERALADAVTKEFDEEYARARQKVTLKSLAEKEHKGKANMGPWQQQGGRGRNRGGRGGFGGRGAQQGRMAAAAAGGSAAGNSGPGQSG